MRARIPLNVHNVLDYVAGFALVLSPYIFGFADLTAARNVFFVLGFGLIGYSLITDYRYSVAKIIPVSMHMAFDVVAGIVIMLAPYVFGYRSMLTGGQTALHFVYGIGVLMLVAFTQPKSTRQSLGKTTDTTTDIRDYRRAA